MAAPNKAPGEIHANTLYTLDEIRDRMGLGKHALRTARRQGLKVKRIGRRGYILGRDLIEWFEKTAQAI